VSDEQIARMIGQLNEVHNHTTILMVQMDERAKEIVEIKSQMKEYQRPCMPLIEHKQMHAQNEARLRGYVDKAITTIIGILCMSLIGAVAYAISNGWAQ